MANAGKRVRNFNFNSEECEKLLAVAKDYASIIECKKTDATTWREKLRAWDKIAEKVNSGTLNKRTAVSLRLKFDTLKRRARKMHSERRQYQLQTGGGPFTPPKEKDEEVLEGVLGMISLSAKGLPACFDSDLASSSRQALVDRDMHSEEEDEGALLNEDELMMGDLHLKVPEAGVEDPEPTVLEEETVQWTKDYGPSMLRRAKHPSLSSSGRGAAVHNRDWVRRRTPSLGLGQQSLPSGSSSNYALLAKSKRELAEMMKVAAATEQAEKTELHKLKISINEAKLQAALLDVQIKQAQLDNLKNTNK